MSSANYPPVSHKSSKECQHSISKTADRQRRSCPTEAAADKYALSSHLDPFWKTVKGRLILGLAGVVILTAVVGGAVGGSMGRKGPAVSTTTTTTTSTTLPTATAAVGTADAQTTENSATPSLSTTPA